MSETPSMPIRSLAASTLANTETPTSDEAGPPASAITVRTRGATNAPAQCDPHAARNEPTPPPSTISHAADSHTVPPPVRIRLVVLRGMKIGVEYPIYEGRNTIGRFVDKPVDIDLVTQEAVEQTWCSRVHSVIVFEKAVVRIEDLNSLNGTWVNGVRIHPGQPRLLTSGDLIQVGTVQLKLIVG